MLGTMYGYPHSIVKANAISLASSLKRRPEPVGGAEIPAFVHSQWSRGYYHWITESLPRAIAVESEAPEATIHLPRTYNSFHIESLKLLGIKFTHFPTHNISTDQAFITSCPKHYGTTASDLILDMSRRLRGNTRSTASFGRRLYISRGDSRGRKISNETEVITALKAFGFEVFYPENHSFEDQVSIFGHADFIVGNHGAGLTNMVFMEEGGSVIELLPFRNGVFDIRPNTWSMKHDDCYVNLAKTMNHQYGYQQCPHDKNWHERTSLANIEVDCAQLSDQVQSFIDRSADQ